VLWLSAWPTVPRASATLVAAWDADSHYRVGLISVASDSWSVQQSVTVPTQPHALPAEPGGTVLAVAWRPGGWLLRWHAGSTHQQWQWIDGDRRFNGCAVASANSACIWRTETDRHQGKAALVCARHAARKKRTGGPPTAWTRTSCWCCSSGWAPLPPAC
jgi:hypothetical protein